MILHGEKRPLDFAFGPGPPYGARPGFDPVVTAQLQEFWIPLEVCGPRIDHECAGVVDHDAFRDAAEVPEGFLERLVDRRLRFIATRPVELTTAVAQDRVVYDHAGAGAAQQDRVRRPIELALLARGRLEALRDTRVRLRRPQVRPGAIERGRGALVATRTDLVENATAN